MLSHRLKLHSRRWDGPSGWLEIAPPVFVTRQSTKLFDPVLHLVLGVLNTCPAINEQDQEQDRLASTSRRNMEKTCVQRPTHFISIPLNLNGSLNSSYSKFKSEALETASGLHESAFMPNAKLHLTVTVVNLSAVSDKSAVMDILFHRLGGIKALNVSLLGLDVIKGTVKECSVLYARVAEPKALDSLFKPIIEEMAGRGLTCDFSIKWHCTLINIKYAEPAVRRCFNATHLIERWKERELGLVVCDQVHLSILNKDIDKDGYYRAEKKFHLVS